jgi:[ribosomal protein S5]-alanine N-acetyltransferase
MESIMTFRTNRLIAERLHVEELDELCRMHQDPRVMATLSGLRSGEQMQQFLRENLWRWDRHGYGLWMFRAQADGRFVGHDGLRHVYVRGRNEAELAYALMAAFWGSELATDMAKAILTVAFEHLGMADLVVFTLTTNQASRRVMEKVGCTFERDIVHAGLPHELYRIKREEYVTASPRPAPDGYSATLHTRW